MTLVGFDIARDQWGMNTALIPHDFAIIGASDGATVNPHFHQQYATEKALGKRRGCYHFFRLNPAAEARFWVANAGEVPGDGHMWLDAETFHPNLPNLVLECLEEVRRLTGIKPAGVYTSADFLLNRGLDWGPVFDANYGLWEAAYVLGYQQVKAYNIPGGRSPVPHWGAPAMWQFTSTGIVPGWSAGIDLNVFNGDAAAWDAYIGVATAESDMITPIEKAWYEMASIPKDNLLQIVTALQSRDFAAFLQETLMNAKAPSVDGKTYTLSDHLLGTTMRTTDLQAKVSAVPAAILNQSFKTGSGATTNVAGILDQIHAVAKAPSAVTLDATQVAQIADQLRATLPADTVKALAAALAPKA